MKKEKTLSSCNQLEIAQLLDISLRSFASFSALEPRMLPVPFSVEDKRRLCLMLEAHGYIEKMSHHFSNDKSPTVFPNLFIITPKGTLFYASNSFKSEYYKNIKALKEASFKAYKIRWELVISIISMIISFLALFKEYLI